MPEEISQVPQLPVSEQEVQIPSSLPREEKKPQDTSDGGRPNVGEAITPPRWRKKKIVLVTIFGIFVLAGAVFAAYKFNQRQARPISQPAPVPTETPMFSPSPDLYVEQNQSVTANWETYVDTEYRYSIKYPKEWTLVTMYAPVVRLMGPSASQEPPLPGPEVQIQARENSYDSLDDWLAASEQGKTPAYLTVDKTRAVEIFESENDGSEYLTVFIPKEKKIFSVGLVILPPVGAREEARETFNLMLSTFRFLNSKPERCDDLDVESVYSCNNGVIKIVSKKLGGGFTLINQEGEEINCPVVNPQYLPEECKNLQCGSENLCE